MRTLTDHIVSGDQAVKLQIETADEAGADGANHAYLISLPPGSTVLGADGVNAVRIQFQKGPIKEVGINGVTGEALIAIQLDHLRGFQSGPYACDDNREALEHFEAGLRCLQRRTLARIARGVEGTYQK